MSTLLSAFVILNTAIAMAYLSFILIRKLGIKGTFELRLHYLALFIVVSLSLISIAPHSNAPAQSIISPAVNIWSAPSAKPYPALATIEGPQFFGESTYSLSLISSAIALIFIGVFFASITLIVKALRKLAALQKAAYGIRQIGRVRILVSDDISVPISFWYLGKAIVMLPSNLLMRPLQMRIAIQHEIQHHRQGDTLWVYAIWGLRTICFVNPFIHLWSSLITEVQEFACDETLVDRKKVESREYIRCLIEVAQSANERESKFACATGFAFLLSRHTLKRRVEKMLKVQNVKPSRAIVVAASLVLITNLAVAGVTSSGLIQDRRVTLSQAVQMAKTAQTSSEFPIVVNESVVRELNRYLGTPDGREFIQRSLTRYKQNENTVKSVASRLNVPEEALAIPIAESGYQNLQENPDSSVKAAGLWQIIRTTARNYGLIVAKAQDDRTDISRSTDAALRYLKSNHLRFQDWQLAILAYNMGEGGVQKAINETGSRDAWTLIAKGYEGDKNYLAKVMAAVLILKNQELIDQ